MCSFEQPHLRLQAAARGTSVSLSFRLYAAWLKSNVFPHAIPTSNETNVNANFGYSLSVTVLMLSNAIQQARIWTLETDSPSSNPCSDRI